MFTRLPAGGPAPVPTTVSTNRAQSSWRSLLEWRFGLSLGSITRPSRFRAKTLLPVPATGLMVKTKVTTATLALLLAITMVACSSDDASSTTPENSAGGSTAVQSAPSGNVDRNTPAAEGSAANSASNGASQQAQDSGQQQDAQQTTAVPGGTDAGASETPTEAPEPTATPEPTLEPNEVAFRWLLDEPEDPRCTIGPKSRETIASQMAPHFVELMFNKFRDEIVKGNKGLSEMRSEAAAVILETLELQRLPDENGELRVQGSFTGQVFSEITPDVYTITLVLNTHTVVAEISEDCGGGPAQNLPVLGPPENEVTITDAAGAKVNPRPEPEPVPELAMMLGEYDAKDQFGNYRYVVYARPKILEYNFREIQTTIEPSLVEHIKGTYPAFAGLYNPEQLSTIVGHRLGSIGGYLTAYDVDWTLNEDNTINVTMRPYLSELHLEEGQKHYSLTIEAVMNLVPAEELPRHIRQFVRSTPLSTFLPAYPVFSHLVENPIKLEPCTFGELLFGGTVLYTCTP